MDHNGISSFCRRCAGGLYKEGASSEAHLPSSSDVRVDDDGALHLPDETRLRWGISPGREFQVKETPQGLVLSPVNHPLSKVYLEPTSACNLQCRTCVRNSWTEKTGSMPLPTFCKLLGDLKGVPSFRTMAFWGIGEPLVHPDIVEMVSLAHESGIRTELITNGLLLDRPMAEGLVKAGLDTMVVSVDGVSADSYADIRCGGSLEQVRENIEELDRVRWELSRLNPEIGLEFVVMKRNVDQLPQLAQTAYQMSASFIIVTNLLPYTEELKDEILYGRSAQSDNAMRRSLCFPEVILPRMDMEPEYLKPLAELIRGSLQPYLKRSSTLGDVDEDHCPFIREGSAAITWAGDVSPCISLMHSHQCFILGRGKSIRRYSVGNIGQEDIKDIWDKKEYEEFRRRVWKFDFPPCTRCGSCELVQSNEEDCLGNPYPVCGDCLWARRVILCP